MDIGQAQIYTVVGGIQPFKVYFKQNGTLVKLQWINQRSFQITALETTERYGVGPVQFNVDEGGGYRCASGDALIYISKKVVSQPPAVNPPAVKPPGHDSGSGGLSAGGTAGGGGYSGGTPGITGGTLDGSQWEMMRATGKGTGFSNGSGQSVNVSGGTLQIFQNATDSGGAVVSKPMMPLPGKVLKITKRTLVHPANNNYTGTTAVLGHDPEKQIYAMVGYYRYGSENYFGAGFLKTGARVAPLWDTWFEETITYDPATGRTTLSVNGVQPVSYQGQATGGPLRIGLHSYGWHTGHYQNVRDLRTEWVEADHSTTVVPGTQPSSSRDLNGIWNCSTRVASDCTAIFYQEGTDVKVTSTYDFQGRRIVWWGAGRSQGSSASIRLHHTTNTAPRDWSDVILDLTLSPDGRTLHGRARTVSGAALDPVQFTRSR